MFQDEIFEDIEEIIERATNDMVASATPNGNSYDPDPKIDILKKRVFDYITGLRAKGGQAERALKETQLVLYRLLNSLKDDLDLTVLQEKRYKEATDILFKYHNTLDILRQSINPPCRRNQGNR